MKLKIKLDGLPATVNKKGKYYISCCPQFDVSSQGESKKKALKNLAEALTLFITTCLEMGTLEKVLKESGFEPAGKSKRLPPGYEKVDLDIPFPYQIKGSEDSGQCHA